jgi:hypothetical protein
MGQRGFALAAQHRLAKQYGMEALYEAASQRFQRIRAALNHVSDQFLFPGRESADRLLRQVSADSTVAAGILSDEAREGGFYPSPLPHPSDWLHRARVSA